eukprot:2377243-Amphidinium_carterae.1
MRQENIPRDNGDEGSVTNSRRSTFPSCSHGSTYCASPEGPVLLQKLTTNFALVLELRAAKQRPLREMG